MTTIIAHPESGEQAEALKSVMKVLKIDFEEELEADDNPYNPEFVAKIKESLQQAKEGKVTRVEKADFKSFLGLE